MLEKISFGTGLVKCFKQRRRSVAGIFVQLGLFFEYLLGTITTWRTAAAISAAIPIATALAITQVQRMGGRVRPA